MTKSKKKSAVKKQPVKRDIKQEVAQVVATVEKQAEKKPLWKILLEYVLTPAVFVAFLSSAPQLIDKVTAYYNNMSYEDYVLARRQLGYWNQYADCITFDSITVTNKDGDEVKLRVCDKDLINAEYKSDKGKKHGYSWIDLKLKVLDDKPKTSLVSSLSAQSVAQAKLQQGEKIQFPQTVKARDGGQLVLSVEKSAGKLCNKTEDDTTIVYNMRLTDKICKVKRVNKLKGIIVIENASCEKICKNP